MNARRVCIHIHLHGVGFLGGPKVDDWSGLKLITLIWNFSSFTCQSSESEWKWHFFSAEKRMANNAGEHPELKKTDS